MTPGRTPQNDGDSPIIIIGDNSPTVDDDAQSNVAAHKTSTSNKILKTSKNSQKNSSKRKRTDQSLAEPLEKGITCPICYTELEDEPSYARIVDCTHTFCLECIRKWSREKQEPSCPMCNINFNFIFEIKLPSRKQIKLDAKTFVKANKIKEGNHHSNSIDVDAAATVGLFNGYSDFHWEYQQRKGIYTNNLKCKKLTNTGNRIRNATPEFFREHPYNSVRLLDFIRRELHAIVPQHGFFQLQNFENQLNEFIRANGLPTLENCSTLLKAIFCNNRKYAEVFCHELKCYAKSPFNSLEQYDANAVYATLADGEKEFRESQKAKRKRNAVIDLENLSPSSTKIKKSKKNGNKIEEKWNTEDKNNDLVITGVDNPNLNSLNEIYPFANDSIPINFTNSTINSGYNLRSRTRQDNDDLADYNSERVLENIRNFDINPFHIYNNSNSTITVTNYNNGHVSTTIEVIGGNTNMDSTSVTPIPQTSNTNHRNYNNNTSTLRQTRNGSPIFNLPVAENQDPENTIVIESDEDIEDDPFREFLKDAEEVDRKVTAAGEDEDYRETEINETIDLTSDN